MSRSPKRRENINQLRNKNVVYLGIFFTIAIIALCTRIVYLQTRWGTEYAILAARQRNLERQASVARDIQPTRGAIMDRHMQPLISTIPVYEVFMDVRMLHAGNDAERERHIAAVQRVLDVPTRDIIALFEQDEYGNLRNTLGSARRVLASDVDANTAFYLRDNYTHLHAVELSQRFFHDPFFAPQVLGFIRGDGSWGLEAFYNDHLSGTPGRTFLANGEIEEIPVRDGFTLITTFDSEIQHAMQRMVDQTFREMDADFVGGIVMNPHTGEIWAMAQAPTFSIADPWNPALTTDLWLQDNWAVMEEHQQRDEIMRSWRNFHITRSYEMGSVFKPVVIAAALEEGVLSVHDTFFCEGGRFVFEDEWVPCWQRHGSLTFNEAIAQSCNVAMFDIVERLGRDTFYRYRRYFGFGEMTGIDLPGETAVSSRFVMYTLADLGPVQRATSSMGQGFNATTIQQITAYAALINGGNILRPFFVSQVVDSFGNIVYENQAPIIERRAISPETSDIIRRSMEYVIIADRGTGRSARIPGHTLGGKTGTGQQGARADGIDSLTFISFTPVENPEFLVLLVVDRIDSETYGGAGGQLGPRTRRLVEEIINIRALQPSDGPNALDYWQAHTASADTMPDFSGMRLADAVRNLSNRGNGGYQVVGSGTIVSHTIPQQGRPMPQNIPVLFHMEPDTRIEGQMVIVPDLTAGNVTVAQAEAILREIGLPAVLIDSMVMASNFNPEDARTMNPLTAEERETMSDEPPDHASSPMSQVIYQQFPAPGTELERGTQVMIRAR